MLSKELCRYFELYEQCMDIRKWMNETCPDTECIPFKKEKGIRNCVKLHRIWGC